MNAGNGGEGKGRRPEGVGWISPETVRKNELRVREAVERAQAVCRAARIEHVRARAQWEKARWLRTPDTMLPPLEFVLPPLGAALAYLERGLPPLPPSQIEPRAGARRPMVTVLYVWGYSFSIHSLVQQAFHETEAARQFATARSWDMRRTGAWAGEQVLPMGLHAALKKLELTLRADLSVTGWGGRVVRGD